MFIEYAPYICFNADIQQNLLHTVLGSKFSAGKQSIFQQIIVCVWASAIISSYTSLDKLTNPLEKDKFVLGLQL